MALFLRKGRAFVETERLGRDRPTSGVLLTPSRRFVLLVLAPVLSTCAKDKPPTTTVG
jgi:hypothetical protein